MAQNVRQIDYGEKIGQGINASLERLIHEKARKIEEKHAYERNLEFLKGANIPNAEQVAHGSNEQILQLLKGGTAGSTVAGNSQYNDLLSQYTSGGQEQPMQQGQQEEIDYDNPTPQVYARPEVQQALRDYMSRPEIQEQYGIDKLNKVNQKLEQYAQQGQQKPSPTQQLMGGSQAQPSAQGGLSPQDKLYDQLLNVVPNKFQYDVLKERRALRQPKGEVNDFDELTKRQPKIIALNKPFNDQLDEEVKINKQIYDLTKRVLEEEAKGETPENALTKGYATYTPGFLNVYSSIKADLDQLAILLSQKTGRPSVYMTQLQQASKPNLSMDKKDRVEKLEHLNDIAEGVLNLDLARKEVKAENGGLEPLNLEHLSQERFIKNVLPDPSEVEPNTKVEAYGVPYKLVNGKWKEISRGK